MRRHFFEELEKRAFDLKPYKNQLIGAGTGLLGGGATGYFSADQREGESDTDFSARRLKRMLVGGGAGALVGGAGGYGLKRYANQKRDAAVTDAAIAGALAAGGVGGLAAAAPHAESIVARLASAAGHSAPAPVSAVTKPLSKANKPPSTAGRVSLGDIRPATGSIKTSSATSKEIENQMFRAALYPLYGGLGGGVTGALGGYYAPSQREDESDEEFHARRMRMAQIAAGLGTMAGGLGGQHFGLKRIDELSPAHSKALLAEGRTAADTLAHAAEKVDIAAKSKPVKSVVSKAVAANAAERASGSAPVQNAVNKALTKTGGALVGGGLGGLVGAGAGYFGSNRRDDESDEEFADRRRRNALMGAGGGAVVGGLAGHGLRSALHSPAAPAPAAAAAAAAAAPAKKGKLRNYLGLGLLGAGAAAAGDYYNVPYMNIPGLFND